MRFVLFATIYAAVVAYWVSTAKGWDGLGLLGASFGFGAMLVPSWWIAIALEHLLVPNPWHRLWAHPVIVFMIFAISSMAAFAGYIGDPVESILRDMKPFGLLVLAGAFVDALVGFLLARKLTPAPDLVS